MTLVYQLTEEELREVHLRQVRRVIRNRLANLCLPWRWFGPRPVVEWVSWDFLIRQCSRQEGFLVARTERNQDVCYRLTKLAPELPPERWVSGTPPGSQSRPQSPST